MTSPEHALAAVVRLLEAEGIPYMLIGGMANAVWGEPRATVAIDITVWVAEDDVPGTVAALTAALPAVVPDPAAFVGQTRVLPLRTADGVRVDLIFGMLPFEEEAIRRAVPTTIAETAVRVCTPEDLILHKIISQRPLGDARIAALWEEWTRSPG